jgi:hypothetical protein
MEMARNKKDKLFVGKREDVKTGNICEVLEKEGK